MPFNKICMDGFTGALMAAESFRDGRAVLHGPGGCRAYHALLSSRCYPRSEPADYKKYSRQYFFGSPLMPCTYIDEDTYINGSGKKLEECIPIICDADDRFNVFITSPGAALIGDNITDAIERSGYGDRAVAFDESLISQPFSASYDHTIRSIVEWKAPKRKDTIKQSVNIIGVPISSNDWQDAIAEMGSMLNDMGITLISTPGAGCSSAELESSTAAEYNVCVCPEYCGRTASFYENEYGIPTIFSSMGAPVGFDAVEGWVKGIGEAMGADTSKVDERIRRGRERVFKRMSGSFLSRRVRGSRFSVIADSSVAYPLTKWLYEYLCLLPVSISVDPGEDSGMVSSIVEFLDNSGLKKAWNSDPSQKVDFLFADGHTAEIQEMVGSCRKGVDIAMPSLSRINFIPRSIFGLNGSMYILDEIFSSL